MAVHHSLPQKASAAFHPSCVSLSVCVCVGVEGIQEQCRGVVCKISYHNDKT